MCDTSSPRFFHVRSRHHRKNSKKNGISWTLVVFLAKMSLEKKKGCVKIQIQHAKLKNTKNNPPERQENETHPHTL